MTLLGSCQEFANLIVNCINILELTSVGLLGLGQITNKSDFSQIEVKLYLSPWVLEKAG